MSNISDRIFRGESKHLDEEEWFYRAREGIGGPYPSSKDAISALHSFIAYCRENGFNGGRTDDLAVDNAAA